MELWDIILPSNLTRFSREVPIPQDYLLNRLLPDVTINSNKARIRTLTRTVRAAKFRAYNAENYIGARPFTLSITDIVLPPVGLKLPLTELEILEKALTGNDPNGDVIAQIYDDAETTVRATLARMELARGDFLTDGKFSLFGENGLTLDADFSLASSHKPTAATLWTDHTNATPLSDEQTWIQQMVNDGSPPPTVAVTSLARINDLRSNSEYRSAYWGGNASSTPVLSPTQLNDVRASWGLPPIMRYDTQIDVDGTTTRVLPENKFLLAADGLGETQWGVTAQALEVSSDGSDVAFTRRDAPGIFTAAYKEHEPVGRWTSTTAVAMPVGFDMTRLISATVA